MSAHLRTSHLPHHRFVASEFWDPWCGFCHERRGHPIHSRPSRGLFEVCGYDGCAYCDSARDPDRGVPNRKKG